MNITTQEGIYVRLWVFHCQNRVYAALWIHISAQRPIYPPEPVMTVQRGSTDTVFQLPAHHGRKQFVPSECHTRVHARTHAPAWLHSRVAGRQAGLSYFHWIRIQTRPCRGPENLRLFSPLCSHWSTFHVKSLSERPSSPRSALCNRSEAHQAEWWARAAGPGPEVVVGEPMRVAAQNLCDALLGARGCLWASVYLLARVQRHAGCCLHLRYQTSHTQSLWGLFWFGLDLF